MAILLAARPAIAQVGPEAGYARKGWRCGTPDELPHFLEKPRAVVPAFALDDEGGTLLERDAFGTMESRTSDHFSLKWGEPGAVDAAHLQPVLDALELSWKHYVETLDHRQPTGANVYFVNAYVGSTGGASPEIDFDGGYASYDDDGYPYLVLSPTLLGDPGAAEVAAHEFYHVIQMSTEAFQYSYDGYWYWEATATWASQEVYPEGDYIYNMLGAYALLPEYSLFYYGDPFSPSLSGARQYGAFIFPRFITEQVASPSVIRDSWELGGPEDLPLDVLGELLADVDTDIDDVFAAFAAHNAGWDYAKGEVYRWIIDAYEDYYPDEAHTIAAEVASEGTDGWVEAPGATAPWAYGYNVIRMVNPVSGAFTVAVQGDAQGSHGSAGVYRATVVRRSTLGFEYQPLIFDGLDGEARIEEVKGELALFLVVTAQPDTRIDQESFGYRYRIDLDNASRFPISPTVTPAVQGRGDEWDLAETGGGCAASRSAPPSLLLFVVLVACPLVRRRRREAAR